MVASHCLDRRSDRIRTCMVTKLSQTDNRLVPQLRDVVEPNPTRMSGILLEESSHAHAARLEFRGFSNRGSLQVVALVLFSVPLNIASRIAKLPRPLARICATEPTVRVGSGWLLVQYGRLSCVTFFERMNRLGCNDSIVCGGFRWQRRKRRLSVNALCTSENSHHDRDS